MTLPSGGERMKVEKGQLRRWCGVGGVFMVMNRVNPRGLPTMWWILQDGVVHHREAGFIQSFSVPVQA
jgi:hypothetical protein